MYISLAPQNCHILQQTGGTVQQMISLLTYVSQTIPPQALVITAPPEWLSQHSATQTTPLLSTTTC